MNIRTFAVAALLVSATVSAENGPTQAIDTLHTALLDVMKNAEALGYQGRYDRLAPLLEQTFDFEFMSRSVLGDAWKDLTPDQQQRWRTAFTELTTATYAGRFKGYTGEEFKTLGQEPAAQDTVFVKTVVVRTDGDNVELTYRLRQTSTGWRIIDIYQKGTVSEIALRRSEYSSVLKRDGFDKLLEVVKAKMADYASGKADI